MFVHIYLFFEIIAFLTAIAQFNYIKQTQYIYFIPYLFFIVVYEAGSIFNWFSINHSNLWISNITMIFSFLFYSTFLYKIIKTPVFLIWIKRVIFLSILCSVINMAFLQGFWKLNTITILLQFAVIIIISCIYFYELMNYTGEAMVIIKSPAFWLNTGLLFFCLSEFLFFSSFAYMAYKNNYNYHILFSVISNAANIILYSCLTVSFLCFSRTRS
jgi:hypothetical protein